MTEEQGELLPREAVPMGPAGALQKATLAAIKAADLDDRDLAGAQLAVQLAAVLDIAARGPKFYVVAPIAQQYRETLAQYGLAPGSRGGEKGDPLDEFLRDLAGTS
jgi:hypothetical protein